MKLEKEDVKQKKENKSKIIIGASVAAVLTFSSIGGWILAKNGNNDVIKFAQSIMSGSNMKDTLSNSNVVQEKPDLDPDQILALEEYLSAFGFGYRTTFLSFPVENLIDDPSQWPDTQTDIKVELLYAFCEDKSVYGWEEGRSDPEEVKPPYATKTMNEPSLIEIAMEAINSKDYGFIITEKDEEDIKKQYEQWIISGRPDWGGDSINKGFVDDIFKPYEKAKKECEEKYENWMTWKTARNEWIKDKYEKGYLQKREPSKEWSDYTAFWVKVAQKALNLSQGNSTDAVTKLNNVLYAQTIDKKEEEEWEDLDRKVIRDLCLERLRWKEGDEPIFIEPENSEDPKPSITPSPSGGDNPGGNTTGGNTTGGNTTGGNTTGGNTTGGNTTGGNTTGGNTTGGNTTGGNTTGGNNTPEQPVVDKVAPSVEKASITSPSAGVYTTGQEIRIRVQFDKNIYGASKKKKIDENTAPKLMIKFENSSENKLMTFDSIGEKSITYTYIVQETDNGKLQIGEGNNYIGTVYNGDGYSADLKNIEKFDTDREIIVDTEAPKVENIEVISQEGDYKIGDEIQIKVTFNKDIYTERNKIPLIEKTAPNLNISFGEGEIKHPSVSEINSSENYIIYTYEITQEDRGDLKIDPSNSFDGTKTIYDKHGNPTKIAEGKELAGNKITVNKDLSQITLNKKEITLDLNKTKIANMSAVVEPQEMNLTWASSNPEVATVDETTGAVTAVEIGETDITATTTDGATATCKVTVKDTTEGITKVELNQTKLELDLNGSKTTNLTATITPKELEVTWSSTDEKIATVDEEGKVTAVGKGEAQIIAKAKDGTTATCEVKVINSNTNEIEPTQIEFDIKNAKVVLGRVANSKEINTILLKVDIKPKESNINKNITYESSNNEVATVDENGKVTIKAKGVTVITATTENGINAYCAIEVLEEAEVKDKKIGDMNLDDRIDITDLLAILRHQAANLTGENARKHQDWLVNDEKYILADIDGNGRIDVTDIIKLQRHMAASKNDTLREEKPDWLISSNVNGMREMYRLGYKTADWLMKR